VNCSSCQAENAPDAHACARCGTVLPMTPTQFIVTVDLRPGVLFDSRYEILGPLGQGGMGMVYKARDRSLDEVVAIKILRPDFAQDPRMADRFKSEIRLARRVRHRNVCAIHDYGEDQGLFYISMEYLEGVDLKHQLRERGALPAADAYDVAIQIAEGLQAVHEAGIIHRDLKTPNIMRDAGGVARLMDFGIAKREGDGTRTASWLQTLPPKQKPTAPTLPVHSARFCSTLTASTKSSMILFWSSVRCISTPLSSLPGYPPSGVNASGAKATKLATARRRATSLTYGVSPRFSWTTTTPGTLPFRFAGFAK